MKQKDLYNSEIIWDKTNIGENYPGITLPLTYSFIKDAYFQVYKNFLKKIWVKTEIIDKNKHIIKRTSDKLKLRVNLPIEIVNNFPNNRSEFIDNVIQIYLDDHDLKPDEKKKKGRNWKKASEITFEELELRNEKNILSYNYIF